MKKPMFSKEEICKMFGCSMENLNKQYASNAETFRKMKLKAIATGKKVGGYTAERLQEAEDRYNQLSKL